LININAEATIGEPERGSPSTAVVLTSIFQPSAGVKQLAAECAQRGIHFIVVGDASSPATFEVPACDFYSLEAQQVSEFQFPQLCPPRRYARKNFGYLVAARRGVERIMETDDDNLPYDSFWQLRDRRLTAPLLTETGWLNVYQYFSDAPVWPRGLPLDQVQKPVPALAQQPQQLVECPIQQGLADDNPDVDAIYRLVLPLPLKFHSGKRAIALGDRTWCPFNSQNTTWWKDAFPLMYLPTYCSFRMTDIWRSFVAQRIAWANGWSILFHEPTMWQERNDHNLMHDFRQEMEGYLRNGELAELLEQVDCRPGLEELPLNLMRCYERLVEQSFVEPAELDLLQAWLTDLLG